MTIVKVKNKDIFCDSTRVAKNFGMKHNDVTRAIKRIVPQLKDFMVADCTPKFEEVDSEYRGRKYISYLMNEDAFVIVMMRFETKRAREWQGRYISAFKSMRVMLAVEATNKESDEWIVHRSDSKQIRLETTDVIKEFVDYATGQGSTKANFYYKHITNATYKALGLLTQFKPKLRDTLGLCELAQLSTAEILVQRSFNKHMKDNIPYKAVYKLVIEDLLRFSESLMLEV